MPSNLFKSTVVASLRRSSGVILKKPDDRRVTRFLILAGEYGRTVAS